MVYRQRQFEDALDKMPSLVAFWDEYIVRRSMASVQAHKGKAVPKKLHRMSIEKAANGVTVHKHYTGGRNEYGMPTDGEEGPSVFTKHAAALKHVKAGLAEMHGEDPDEGEMGNGATAAGNP